MIIDFYNRNGGGGGSTDLSGVVASADLAGTTLNFENNSGTTIDSVELSGITGDATVLEPKTALPTSAATGSVFATNFAPRWVAYDSSAQQQIRVHKVGEYGVSVSWDMPIEEMWTNLEWNENDGLTMSGGWNWEKDENDVWHPNSSYDASEQPSAVYEDGDYIYINIVPSAVVFTSAYDLEKMEMLVPATNSLYQADSQSGATTIYKEYAKKDEVTTVQTYAESANTLAQSAYTYADSVNTRLDNFSATKLGAVNELPDITEKGNVISVVNSADTGVYLAGDSGYTGNWTWSAYDGQSGYKAYRDNQGRMGLNLTVQDVDGLVKFYWDGQNSVWNTGETGGESWTFTFTDSDTAFTAISSPNNVTASGYVDNGYVYVILSNPSDGDYGGNGATDVGVPEVASAYDNLVSSSAASKIVALSQNDYDALVSGGTVDNKTIYVIV